MDCFRSLLFGVLPVFTIFLAPLHAQESRLDSLERLIKAHSAKDTQRADLLNQLAYQLQFSDPKRGLEVTEEVIGFSGKLEDKSHLYWAYLTKSNNLLQLSRYTEALENARIALEGFRALDAKPEMAAAYSAIGIVYNHINNYPKALENLQQSARIQHEIQDPQESTTHLNIARIYGETKQYDKAQEYLDKANKQAIATGNRMLQSYCVFNMAALMGDTKRPSDGLVLFDSALTIAKSLDDRTMVGRIYGNIGITFSDLQQYDSAAHYFRLAIDYNAQIGNLRSQALALMGLSKTYSNTNQPTAAYRYALAALDQGKSLGMIDLQQTAAESLSEYHEKYGKIDSSLYYYKQQTLLKDSINNENKQAELTRLEMQYDFDLKEQAYLQQQALSALRIRQLWGGGLLVFIGFVALGGIYFYRSKLRTTRLRNELREKELIQQAETLAIRQRLSESELKALRSQMNPHFIYNVLNSIEFYILENEAIAASKLVQRFSKLSRLVLENSTRPLVAADREWEVVVLYLELEAERFDHAFDYVLEGDLEVALSTILLPPMLIQPLVENAIHHGIRPLSQYRGVIRVGIEQQASTLVVTVTDNGVGLSQSGQRKPKPQFKEQSLGIESIRERLSLLAASYPDVQSPSFTLREFSAADGPRTEARLVLPYLTMGDIEVLA